MAASSRAKVVASLGTAQILAWASTVYLPAVLADPVAAGLHISRDLFFGLFSGASLLAALLSPVVGRAIDRGGGRGVLMLSSLVLAAGLVLLAMASGPIGLTAAWAVLGIGMALGLYEPAFSTLAGLYGRDARGAITGITLIGGFASTIGWPATDALSHALSWQGACLVWAALHLGLGLQLYRSLPPAPPPERSDDESQPAPQGNKNLVLLAIAFATAAFVTGAMAAHLPRLLVAAGVGPAAAIATAALVGPAQVAARLGEWTLLRQVPPLRSARLATALHPLGAACLFLVGGVPGATMLALLHGAGNGMLTIARGTVPLALLGPNNYGRRTGLLAVPARATQAAAPILFSLLLDRAGAGAALALSSGLSAVAFCALFVLRPRDTSRVGGLDERSLDA